MKDSIINFTKKYQISFILLILSLISFSSFFYFFQNDQLLLYGDSLSRMNISRKILDNLTPGVAQLGNVWLPLPQLLMLPFIWNNYLWHVGIAGSIVSMASFIIGGMYLYKAMKLLTNSFFASILSLSIYALNINLLYLQTTAMSESIFLCSLSIAIYYFIAWIKSENQMHFLMQAAIAISAATLIRYEALAILFSSIPMVFFYMWFKTRNYHNAESNSILYAVLACLGFLFWTIYLTAIFGDPLYWKNYYTATHIVGDDKTQLHTYTYNLTFVQAFWKYLTAIVWMNGLIPTILAALAIPWVFIKSFRDKSFYFLPIFISFAMYAFMILTLQRNTPIDQPALTIANLLSPNTNDFLEFNIRYGLLMLPMITLLCSYLFGIRSILLKILLMGLLGIQFYSYYYPQYSVIFQLPRNVSGNITQGSPKEKAMMKWMKQNYQDDGLIMISALKHDPQMLQIGVDYKTYIHEGTGRYWKESRKDPQRYATWVILDSYNKDDQVTKYLKNATALKLYYNRVYENDGMEIYKIKTHPDVILNK